MPRILKTKNCPHCGAELGSPPPRVCPSCAGSIQQRHLKAGCLHAGPAIFLLGAVLLRYLDTFL